MSFTQETEVDLHSVSSTDHLVESRNTSDGGRWKTYTSYQKRESLSLLDVIFLLTNTGRNFRMFLL